MSNINNIDQKIAEFNQILVDFEDGKIPLEQAADKYQQAIKLADLIKSHFGKLKNEITVLSEDFSQDRVGKTIDD